jgi:hypothetical protein
VQERRPLVLADRDSSETTLDGTWKEHFDGTALHVTLSAWFWAQKFSILTLPDLIKLRDYSHLPVLINGWVVDTIAYDPFTSSDPALNVSFWVPSGCNVMTQPCENWLTASYGGEVEYTLAIWVRGPRGTRHWPGY